MAQINVNESIERLLFDRLEDMTARITGRKRASGGQSGSFQAGGIPSSGKFNSRRNSKNQLPLEQYRVIAVSTNLNSTSGKLKMASNH
jgi:hypothetical protein